MNRRSIFPSLLALLGIGGAAAQTRINQNQIRPGVPGKLLGADMQPVTVGAGLSLDAGVLTAPAAPTGPAPNSLTRVLPTAIDAAAGVYAFGPLVNVSSLFVVRNGIWDSPNAGNVADDATASITIPSPSGLEDMQFFS